MELQNMLRDADNDSSREWPPCLPAQCRGDEELQTTFLYGWQNHSKCSDECFYREDDSQFLFFQIRFLPFVKSWEELIDIPSLNLSWELLNYGICYIIYSLKDNQK